MGRLLVMKDIEKRVEAEQCGCYKSDRIGAVPSVDFLLGRISQPRKG